MLSKMFRGLVKCFKTRKSETQKQKEDTVTKGKEKTLLDGPWTRDMRTEKGQRDRT